MRTIEQPSTALKQRLAAVNLGVQSDSSDRKSFAQELINLACGPKLTTRCETRRGSKLSFRLLPSSFAGKTLTKPLSLKPLRSMSVAFRGTDVGVELVAKHATFANSPHSHTICLELAVPAWLFKQGYLGGTV